MSHCARLLLRLEKLAPVFSNCAAGSAAGKNVFTAQRLSPKFGHIVQSRGFQAFTPVRFSSTFEVIKELNTDEQAQVQELRSRIEDILPKFKNDHARHDLNLFKFLKAKDFDLDKAEEMIRKHIEWRTEKEMDTILSRRVPPEIEQDYAFKVTGFDKYGYPVVVSNLGRWELKKTLDKDLKEAFLTYILQMFEQAVDIGVSISTPENYVGQMHLIFDMDGFGLRHLAQPDVISAIQEMVKMLQENYPGSTIGVQIIQAPMTFQFFWSIIQGTLTERTRKKTNIVKGDTWKTELLESIDPDNLPSQYGGAINTCFDYKLELGMNSIPQFEVIPEEEMKTVVIPGGGSIMEEFDLVQNNKISWNFKTETNPVQFRVANGYDGDIVCPHEVNSHSFVQKGLINSDAGGKYTLEFVNNSSNPETLKYAVRIHH